jgi:hypothetical protein
MNPHLKFRDSQAPQSTGPLASQTVSVLPVERAFGEAANSGDLSSVGRFDSNDAPGALPHLNVVALHQYPGLLDSPLIGIAIEYSRRHTPS